MVTLQKPGIMAPIYKSGDTQNSNNYSGIFLLNYAGCRTILRKFKKILYNCLQNKLEKKVISQART